MLKLFPLLLIFIFICGNVHGQDTVNNKVNNYKKRYIIYTTPVKKNTEINGVAIGLWATTWLNEGANSLKINGLNLEIEPFAFFTLPTIIFGSFMAPFHRDSLNKGQLGIGNYNVFVDNPTSFTTQINGVTISGGGTSSYTKVNGVNINGIIGLSEVLNGLEVSGLMNLHYSFNGLIIAGFRNKTTTGRGVQIALFNTSKEGQLLQIGLLNRIGKRITPIINFSFGKI